METDKPPRIYDQLVENKDDFLGILAYSVYKRQKNEVIARVGQQGETVLQAELQRFYDLCNSETQLSYFKTEAEQLAKNFTREALNEVTKEYDLDYESRLKEELRR